MNNASKRDMLLSRIRFFEGVLAETYPHARIQIAGLKSQIARLQTELANFEPGPEDALTATFRGKHVNGSRSINAKVASELLKGLSEAIVATSLSIENRLSDAGKLTEEDLRMPHITRTAAASFGFVLKLPESVHSVVPERGDEAGPDDTDITLEPVNAGLEVLRLIRIAAEGDDEELSDTISVLNDRAVRKVHSFLEVADRTGTTLKLSQGDEVADLYENDAIEKALKSLSEDRVSERDIESIGKISGIFPAYREAEFELDELGKPEKAKIGKEIPDPVRLQRKWVQRYARLTVREVTVKGRRPKYTILRLDSLPPDEERQITEERKPPTLADEDD